MLYGLGSIVSSASADGVLEGLGRLLSTSSKVLSEPDHDKIGHELVLFLRDADRDLLFSVGAGIQDRGPRQESQNWDTGTHASPSKDTGVLCLPDVIAGAFPSYAIRVRVRSYFGQLKIALALAQRSFSRADLNVVLSETALRGDQELAGLVSEVLTELQVQGLLKP